MCRRHGAGITRGAPLDVSSLGQHVQVERDANSGRLDVRELHLRQHRPAMQCTETAGKLMNQSFPVPLTQIFLVMEHAAERSRSV